MTIGTTSNQYKASVGTLNKSTTCCWYWDWYVNYYVTYAPVYAKKTTDCKRWDGWALTWRYNGRDCVSNHRRLGCLLNRLIRRSLKKKHQSSASLAFVRGIHRWPVNSPLKGPVKRKMFPSSIWWRHHEKNGSHESRKITCTLRW